jgi:hypothetical protein
VLPLAALVRRLRQIIVASLVAGLVSRIGVIRRPPPCRQVAVLNVLAVKELEDRRNISKPQDGSRRRAKSATQPQAGTRPKQRKLTSSGGDSRLQGTSP